MKENVYSLSCLEIAMNCLEEQEYVFNLFLASLFGLSPSCLLHILSQLTIFLSSFCHFHAL